MLRPVDNPPNPWSSTDVEYLDGEAPDARLVVYEDHSRSIIASNDSPDLGFRFSANPYRGCFHACAYCYARPGHEYLGMGAGTDFDRRIVVKPAAVELLREAFEKRAWKGDLIVFSGVTDCYQPLEASYRLTRGMLEVCAEYKNPVSVITKAPLIERDIDVLSALARATRLTVTLSIPFWDPEKARALEPFVATPARRVRTIEKLAAAGIRVGVNVAPVVPGLGDEEIARVLTAAREAGATHAGMTLLRLPGPVKEIFEARVREALPLRADKILRRVRDVRGGKLNESTFGARMHGQGPYAQTISALFKQTATRLGFRLGWEEEESEAAETPFERPPRKGTQLGLFGS